MKIMIIGFMISSALCAQTCSSISAVNSEWHSVDTAPRDGRIIEMLETFGAAPTYGIYRWTIDSFVMMGSSGGGFSLRPMKLAKPQWCSVDRPGTRVSEDHCLFWRPYKLSKDHRYIDPTGGKQFSVKYWCDAIQHPYDAQLDRCK